MPTARKKSPGGAAEGLDVGLELVAEGGFAQEHPREEGAHRGRQPARGQEQRRAQHDEERARGHHLAPAEGGEDAEQGLRR
jgi:hypothetical protein